MLSTSILRLAYVCEFWLVLLATHVVWPQAGGQGHLDIMEWYWKLFLPIALAISIVCLTMAAVQGENFWNGKAIFWFVLAICLALGMSMVTYYYHLHENDNIEETVTDDTASRSSLSRPIVARPTAG